MDAKERDRKIKIVLLEVQQALLTPGEGLKAIREVSEEYAKQKCIEQKKICLSSYDVAVLNERSPDTAIISASLATDK